MRINHNIAALNTYRQLSTNQTNSSKALEKLSSGLRINRAGDDAAGLAISEKMRGQIRGLDQASRNAQDGISLIQTAEGALNESHSILQRMKELATQASNDTNTTSDRAEIQKEMNQLTSEINRIGNTTEFNTQKLLNGGAATATVAVNEATAPDLGTAVGQVGSVATTTPYAAGSATPSTATLTFTDLGVNGESFTINGFQFNWATAPDNSTPAAGSWDVDLGSDGATAASAFEAAFNAAKADATANGGGELDNISVSVSGGVVTFSESNGDNTITLDDGSSIANASTSGTTFSGGSPADPTEAVFNFDITTNFAAGDELTIGTETFTFGDGTGGTVAVGADVDATAANLRTAITAGTTYDATGSNGNIVLTQKTAASGSAPTVSVAGPGATAGVYDFSTASPIAAGGSYTIDGQEILVVDDATAYSTEIAAGTAMLVGATADEQATNLAAAVEANATLSASYNASATGSTVQLTQDNASLTGPSVSTSEEAGADGSYSAQLQIGANTGQSFTIEVNDMRSAALEISTADRTVAKSVTVDGKDYAVAWTSTNDVTNGTDNAPAEYALDVSSHDNATAAIKVLDDAINTVSAERSKLGAFQNRLEHTINNLGTSSENLTAAESRIRDVDMAKEMMNFTKNNILSQAAQAMMAQANQQPQGVLQLLR